jgi:hypothetical protein
MITRSKIEIIVQIFGLKYNICTMVANSQGDIYYKGDGYGYRGDWRGNG